MSTFWSSTINIVVSLVINLIAAWVFLKYILAKLKPKFVISDVIACHDDIDPTDQQLKKSYVFKVINMSKYKAFDIQALATIQKSHVVDSNKNMNVRSTDITLRNSSLPYIVEYQDDEKCRPYALHAWLFRTYDDLETILKDDDNGLEFVLIARHGLSGLSACFPMFYEDEKRIKPGKFKFGNSLEIKS